MAHVERGENGELVIVDPVAVGVATAVAKHNCRTLLEMNADRIKHFRQRAVDLGYTDKQVCIAILNADDAHGRILADMSMPRHDFQQYRDRGELPVARGLVTRDGMEAALSTFDDQAAVKLQEFEGLAVVVVDHGVAEVFPVE